jgi:transcriptional regulator with XRE-family HTH domain
MNGKELKSIRKKMKKTQAEFGKLLGVSQEMISMMEEGEKSVPASIAKKLGSGGMFNE